MSVNVPPTKTPGLHSETMSQHKATGAPVVVDLGKRKKKLVKELRQGKAGKLLRDVQEAVDALKAQKAISPDAQTVIVVVREKERRGAATLFGL